MTTFNIPNQQSKLYHAMQGISIATTIIGISVTLGWFLDLEILKTVFPGYSSMKLNTAISFTMAGIVFQFLLNGTPRKYIVMLTVPMLLINLITFLQTPLQMDLGIDQLLLADTTSIMLNVKHPGRMAPTTSASFVLMGIAIFLIDSRRHAGRVIAQGALHIVTLISSIAIIGYLLKIPDFYTLSFLTSMAVHTAIALFILSIGLSLLNPNLGVTALFTGERTGSVMARRLFPTMIVIVLILGFLRLQAHRFNLVSVEFGGALYTLCFVLSTLFLLWDASRVLNKLDARRKKAENEVIELNHALQAALRQRDIEMEAIFDSALVSIIGTDKNGTITHFNKGAEVLLGYSKSEVLGKTDPTIFHDPTEMQQRSAELSEKFGTPVQGFSVFTERIKQGLPENQEWTFVRKDGSKFPVQLVVTPIKDTNSEIHGFVGIATDISDLAQSQKKLENTASELQAKNKQLLNFAHISSHNLRAPVSNLNALMNLHRMSNTLEEKAEVFGYFETAVSNITSTLNELIESLKIQQDNSQIMEPINMVAALEKTKEKLSEKIRESAAQINANFNEIPEITYSRAYMDSILFNLVSNAIKFSWPGRAPKVELQTKMVDGVATLSVKDNGLGIDLQRHGDKLFGLNKTFHRHPEARGLGLFMTKTQVDALGGKISVESEVGKGTIFTVTFKPHKN